MLRGFLGGKALRHLAALAARHPARFQSLRHLLGHLQIESVLLVHFSSSFKSIHGFALAALAPLPAGHPHRNHRFLRLHIRIIAVRRIRPAAVRAVGERPAVVLLIPVVPVLVVLILRLFRLLVRILANDQLPEQPLERRLDAVRLAAVLKIILRVVLLEIAVKGIVERIRAGIGLSRFGVRRLLDVHRATCLWRRPFGFAARFGRIFGFASGGKFFLDVIVVRIVGIVVFEGIRLPAKPRQGKFPLLRRRIAVIVPIFLRGVLAAARLELVLQAVPHSHDRLEGIGAIVLAQILLIAVRRLAAPTEVRAPAGCVRILFRLVDGRLPVRIQRFPRAGRFFRDVGRRIPGFLRRLRIAARLRRTVHRFFRGKPLVRRRGGIGAGLLLARLHRLESLLRIGLPVHRRGILGLLPGRSGTGRWLRARRFRLGRGSPLAALPLLERLMPAQQLVKIHGWSAIPIAIHSVTASHSCWCTVLMKRHNYTLLL